MAAQCERPVIMPMSNPTSRCECSAEEAYRWTDGRAIVATGSPFSAVEITCSDGTTRTFTPSQCNNMYVFPGLGLAASVGGITKFTDQMLYEVRHYAIRMSHLKAINDRLPWLAPRP